jgi:hypothetical protein
MQAVQHERGRGKAGKHREAHQETEPGPRHETSAVGGDLGREWRVNRK